MQETTHAHYVKVKKSNCLNYSSRKRSIINALPTSIASFQNKGKQYE